jgi:hypothetical protein
LLPGSRWWTRVHVRTTSPIVVRRYQLHPDFVFEHMRRWIDLNVHGPPQGDSHRRTVRRRGSVIIFDVSLLPD